MPRLLYSKLGMHRQLNEIIMAGSHDAAINRGDANEKTQNLDILKQAKAGVRFFDIRINAKDLGGGQAELRAFHGPAKGQAILTPKSTHNRDLTNLPNNRGGDVETTNLRAGTGVWG